MNKKISELLREWVKAEIDAAFAAHTPGEDGYYGNSHREDIFAEELFQQFQKESKE